MGRGRGGKGRTSQRNPKSKRRSVRRAVWRVLQPRRRKTSGEKINGQGQGKEPVLSRDVRREAERNSTKRLSGLLPSLNPALGQQRKGYRRRGQGKEPVQSRDVRRGTERKATKTLSGFRPSLSPTL